MIKEKIAELYLRKILLPKAQVINVPGNIYFNINKRKPIFIRQFLLPELIFINLETKAKKGGYSNLLYHAGKKFGWRFASIGNFPNVLTSRKKEALSFLKLLHVFIGGVYAESVALEVNFENKMVAYSTKNFIVVSKIGYGSFMPCGAAAGMIAYIFQDPNIEMVLTSVKDDRADGLCAPGEVLLDKGYSPIIFHDINGDLEPSRWYAQLNKVTSQGGVSLLDLINNKVLSYKNGTIQDNKGNRFSIFEASSMYLIEKEYLIHGKEEDFGESVYLAGKGIFVQMRVKDMAKYLTAMGFGNVVTLRSGSSISFIIRGFPWTKWAKDINFMFLTKFIEGGLSNIYNKVTLKSIKKKVDPLFNLEIVFEVS